MSESLLRVVLDACVIFRSTLRDTLLRAAEEGLYEVRWSDTRNKNAGGKAALSIGGITMKRVPTEAEILEILELAKGAAQKSRKPHQMLLKNSVRRQSLRRARLATKRKTASTENVSAES